jgi:hypothetical protein
MYSYVHNYNISTFSSSTRHTVSLFGIPTYILFTQQFSYVSQFYGLQLTFKLSPHSQLTTYYSQVSLSLHPLSPLSMFVLPYIPFPSPLLNFLTLQIPSITSV